jgi:hypothetical protein
MKCRIAAVVSLALCCSGALGQSPRTAITAQVGDAKIMLVAPKGDFAQVTSAVPELARLGQEFTPPTNRLLAHFVRTPDLQPKTASRNVVFTRYFLVQTSLKGEPIAVDPDQFGRAKKIFHGQQAEMLAKLDPPVAALVPRVGKLKAAELDGLKPGDFFPAGIFQDTDRALSFGTLSRLQYTEGKYKAESLMLTVTTILLIKQKAIFLYTYTKFNGPADLAWAKSTALAWSNEILALNQ